MGVHGLNNTGIADRELTILEKIYHAGHAGPSSVRQRDLAHIAGVSLGMANSIIKRLTLKGWVVVRRVNSRNVQYAVSPSGMREIARRSYRFVRRTIRDIAYYKETLEQFVLEVGRRGYAGVVLEGPSDLDFILEHVCAKAGLVFGRGGVTDNGFGRDERRPMFVLYGEGSGRQREASKGAPREGRAFLKDILIGR